MFDPSRFSKPEEKHLPVILLLDVSGSMGGEKINKLYDAVVEMVDDFVDQAEKEVIIEVAIFTFGADVQLHTKYTPVADLKATGIPRFVANGQTPLGHCLEQAKAYIDDREETDGSNYAPTVVVVSDGEPTDNWRPMLKKFITQSSNADRSYKSQRLAVAIGSGANRDMLEEFTGDPSLVFYAEDASSIADSFKKVTMSVKTQSRLTNPDGVPTNNRSFDKGKSVRRTSLKSKNASSNGNNDDLDF